MPNMIVCTGDIIQPAIIAGRASLGVAQCSVEWTVVPYVEPSDSTAIYAQLVALNEFDPLQIAGLVTFCLATFIVGFGVGVVINKLRRV